MKKRIYKKIKYSNLEEIKNNVDTAEEVAKKETKKKSKKVE